MTRDGRVQPSSAQGPPGPPAGSPRRWEGIPLFARPFLNGCWSEEEDLPRLLPEDLQHPEHFHERLAAWLMKQH